MTCGLDCNFELRYQVACQQSGSVEGVIMSKSDSAGRFLALEQGRVADRESMMPDVVVVYWRDIPAQVIVGKGRAASKVKLHERFEQAIDRCAMKIGARADSYLAEWRKADPYSVEGDQAEVAAAEAERIETEFDASRLKSLIDAHGRA